MNVRVEQVRDKVMGLRPVYSDLGNCTEILLIDGQVGLDRRGIKSVLAAFARSYALDLSAQRDLLRTKIDRKMGMPFCIGTERVFVPLKMRQVLTTNDLAYGYIDVRFIPEDIRSKDNACCEVVLTNGLALEIFSSRGTVLKSKNYGRQLLEFLEKSDLNKQKEQNILDSARVLGQLLADMNDLLERIERKLLN